MRRLSIYYWLIFISHILLLSSCNSTKFMAREISTIKTSLGYEVTNPEYQGNLYCNVNLNPIYGAGLVPRTNITKAGTTVVPLIIFNYVGEKFQLNLGESSLNTPYGRFLTDAFLAEANTSSSFNLYESHDKKNKDKDFTVDIKVGKCQTTSLIKMKSYSFLWVDLFWGDSEMMTLLHNKAFPANVNLEMEVTLRDKDFVIMNKMYSVDHIHIPSSHAFDTTFHTSWLCIDNMAEGLSIGTKKIVEEITADLSQAIELYFY